MDDLIRAVDFEFEVIERAAGGNDGLTLEGYAAVFNTPARINNWEGNFDEVILPGAFRSSIERSVPKLMFEHGHHPLIGNMPLGTIDQASEDMRGLHIKASLSDNWLIQPVRDAIRDKAVTGMSFRMVSASIVDKWERRSNDVDLRSIAQLDCPELGPVVFPAYTPTTVAVRSILDRLTLPKGAQRGKGTDSRAVPDDTSYNDVTSAVCEAICSKLGLPDYVYVWVADLSDTWAIYNLGDDYFKVAYTMGDSGNITIDGDPAAVEQVTSWVTETDQTNSAKRPLSAARARNLTGQPDARSVGDGANDPPGTAGPVPATPTPKDLGTSRQRLLRAKGLI